MVTKMSNVSIRGRYGITHSNQYSKHKKKKKKKELLKEGPLPIAYPNTRDNPEL